MANITNDPSEETPIRVRRGRVATVDLYEIKDSELDIFEKGAPTDLQLNFAIFLVSVAFSSLAALITSTFPNDTVKTVFIIVTVVGFLLSLYLFIAWYRNHESLRVICRRIRERIPPEPVPATVTYVAPTTITYDVATVVKTQSAGNGNDSQDAPKG